MVLMPEPGWLLRVPPAEVLKLTLEYFPGLVLFQAGGDPLPEALRLARQAQELGADGILCLPPSYFADAPTEGLVAYLRAVAAAVEIPLILYNFPRHTRNALTPAILAQVEHAGLKDSAGNLALLAATPRYFIGDDARIHRALRAGARGFVSAAANAAPALYVALEQAAQAQCWREVARLQVRIRRLLECLGGQQIAALKYGVRAMIQDFQSRCVRRWRPCRRSTGPRWPNSFAKRGATPAKPALDAAETHERQ